MSEPINYMWFSTRCNVGPFFSSESNDIIILFIYNFISLSSGLIENNKEKRGVETDKESFDCKIRCAHCPDYNWTSYFYEFMENLTVSKNLIESV